FPVLDACLHLYAGEKMCCAEIVEALGSLFPAIPLDQRQAWVTRFTKLFTSSIYKWVQSPLSLHVGSLDLERERALQMPVVQKSEWADTRVTKGSKDAKDAKVQSIASATRARGRRPNDG